MAREAVVVEAVRTGIGKRGGALSQAHPVDLSADVLTALAARTGIDPAIVDDVIWGCVGQVGDQAGNIGRFAVLAAGWPESVPGTTINRACGSSQQAFEFAVQQVLSGQHDVVVAGGVEMMSRVPLGAARATGFPYGPRVLARYDDFSFNQGESAERIAERWGLSRTDLDEYASRYLTGSSRPVPVTLDTLPLSEVDHHGCFGFARSKSPSFSNRIDIA